jgi:hypothetical protein
VALPTTIAVVMLLVWHIRMVAGNKTTIEHAEVRLSTPSPCVCVTFCLQDCSAHALPLCLVALMVVPFSCCLL